MLKLLPPGARGNKTWLVYGRRDGKVVERGNRMPD
jgi:hypothetical protein